MQKSKSTGREIEFANWLGHLFVSHLVVDSLCWFSKSAGRCFSTKELYEVFLEETAWSYLEWEGLHLYLKKVSNLADTKTGELYLDFRHGFANVRQHNLEQPDLQIDVETLHRVMFTVSPDAGLVIKSKAFPVIKNLTNEDLPFVDVTLPIEGLTSEESAKKRINDHITNLRRK